MSVNKAEKKQKEYDSTKAPFSWDKLDGLLAYKSSLVVCSDILDCPESTIQNHIRKRYNLSFSEYSDRKLSKTKVKLVQRAIESALSGNTTLMIFCLKNLCGWSDNNEDQAKNTNIEITIEKRDSEL